MDHKQVFYFHLYISFNSSSLYILTFLSHNKGGLQSSNSPQNTHGGFQGSYQSNVPGVPNYSWSYEGSHNKGQGQNINPTAPSGHPATQSGFQYQTSGSHNPSHTGLPSSSWSYGGSYNKGETDGSTPPNQISGPINPPPNQSGFQYQGGGYYNPSHSSIPGSSWSYEGSYHKQPINQGSPPPNHIPQGPPSAQSSTGGSYQISGGHNPSHPGIPSSSWSYGGSFNKEPTNSFGNFEGSYNKTGGQSGSHISSSWQYGSQPQGRFHPLISNNFISYFILSLFACMKTFCI